MTKQSLSLLLEEAMSSDDILKLLWDFKSAIVNRLDIDTNYSVRASVSKTVLDCNTSFDRGIKDVIVDNIVELYNDEGLLES